jgi:hypothetical protein
MRFCSSSTLWKIVSRSAVAACWSGCAPAAPEAVRARFSVLRARSAWVPLKEEKAFRLRLPLSEKTLNFDVPGVQGIVDQL